MKIGEIVNISYAAIIESTYAQVKNLVERKKLKMSKYEYHCRGQFTLMHRGKPDDKDISDVSEFIKECLNKQ